MNKQETLEEVIENLLESNYSYKDDGGDRVYYDTQVKECILAGVNWQAERMYSEEEVIELLQKYRYDLSSGKTPNIGDTTKYWFEKFKKK